MVEAVRYLLVELVPLNKCPQKRQGHRLIAVDERSWRLGTQVHIHLTPDLKKSGHVLQALRVRRGRDLRIQSRRVASLALMSIVRAYVYLECQIGQR
jgi:hypothetical protein